MKKLSSMLFFSMILMLLVSQQSPTSRNIVFNRESYSRKRAILEDNKPLIDSIATIFKKVDSGKSKLKYKLTRLKLRQKRLINQVDSLEMLSTFNYYN